MEKKFDKSIFLKQFQQEAEEHIQALNQGLLSLEKDPQNRQILDEIFRVAHTLKGSCTMMGFQDLRDLAHAMEDVLDAARSRQKTLASEDVDILFETLDNIKMLLEGKGEGQEAKVDVSPQVGKIRDILKQKEAAQGGKPSETAPPVEQAGSAPPATRAAAQAGDSIRVEVNKLDYLLNLTGELTISRGRLYEMLRELRRLRPKIEAVEGVLHELKEESYQLPPELQEGAQLLVNDFSKIKDTLSELTEKLFEASGRVDIYSSQIQEGVMQIRMLPLSTVFALFPRMVRDGAKEQGKQINLHVKGSGTELDKRIIDQIQDPLKHLINNAMDHGIESPQERRAAGKPESGTIWLRAYPRGSQVIIESEDDGRGIDPERIKQSAVRKGLITEEEALHIEDEEQIFKFLFTPGFSTADQITKRSGRGVGLDAVKERVEQLKGSVEITSKKGKGTKFVIRLPLTLSLTEVLLVMEAGESFAIPLSNIEEMVRVRVGDVQRVGDKEAIPLRDQLVPLVKLATLLALPRTAQTVRSFPVVVVGSGERRLGIWVDQLIGKQEIVIKSFGSFLPRVENLAGATILGSGEIVPILDVLQMIQHAKKTGRLSARRGPSAQPAVIPAKKRTILVVEDSLTTRELERGLLEAAGFQVVTAIDGQDGMEKLKTQKFDLVLADIEMPRMDGLSLIRQMRTQEAHRDIPVVIVTTRDSDEDKRKGMEAGADAYFVKSQFDQDNLLETVRRLIS